MEYQCAFCSGKEDQITPPLYVGEKKICGECKKWQYTMKGIEFCTLCRQPIPNLEHGQMIVSYEYLQKDGKAMNYYYKGTQILCPQCADQLNQFFKQQQRQ